VLSYLQRQTADFSAEALKAKRAWNDVLQALKENNYKTRLFHPAKLPFQITGQPSISSSLL
jgi:hypothetical protein